MTHIVAGYATQSASTELTEGRTLTAGAGISLTDGGAGSTLTIAATGEGVEYEPGTVSNPPTQAELTTLLGSPITAGAGKTYIVNDATGFTREYLVASDGFYWWVLPLVKTAYTEPTGGSASNAAAYLTIPTYDGSGQAVHPDVYYNPDGWNGYKYWMIMTPYPSSNDDYENPSIIASDDGTTWAVPAGLTNPLAAFPGGSGSNGDPDLVVDGSTMYAFWYTTNGTSTCQFYYRTSTDGVTWTDAVKLFDVVRYSITVPTWAYDGALWRVWSIDIRNVPIGPYTMEMRTCATLTGTYGSAQTCTLNNTPSGRQPWHVEVIRRGRMWHAFVVFVTPGSDNGALYFATSSDGLTWTVQSNPLLSPTGTGTWDNAQIYRASGVITAAGYDLFYSAWTGNPTNQWHIGRTQVTLT